jgi:hypothetical protein
MASADTPSAADARDPDELLRQIRETREGVERLVEETADDRLVRRPAEGAWSVVEHVNHLVKVDDRYLDLLEGALREAREAGTTGSAPFRGSWLGRFFVRSMEPPVKRRVKTLSSVEPDADLDPGATLEAFREVEDRLESTVERSHGLDLDRIRTSSIFLPRWLQWIKIPVFSWFGVLTAHDRRHLWLMHETLERLDEG